METKEAKEIIEWIYTKYPLHKVLKAINIMRPKLIRDKHWKVD